MLITIAKCWKQPVCPLVMSDQKTVVHLPNAILCSINKEGPPTLRDSMDGTGEHYTNEISQAVKCLPHGRSVYSGPLSIF